MYPTKSMLDYMTEMNRLFPRTTENDLFQYPVTPNTSQQSFNQSSLARSSSSTDTSPDSFPDMTAHRSSEIFHRQYENRYSLDKYDMQQYEYQRTDRFESPMKPLQDPFLTQQMYETPYVERRQRPIVGRKIMAVNESQMKNVKLNVNECQLSNVEWPEESLSYTPPKVDQKSNQNAYELFPSGNKEFRTPIKTSPNSFATSPKMSDVSPRMACPSMINMSPRMTVSPSPMDMSQRFPEMPSRMAGMPPRMADMSPMTEMSPRMADISPRMAEMSPRMTNMPPRMTGMSPRLADMSPRMADMSPRMADTSPNRKISPPTSTSPYTQRFSVSFKEPILGPMLFRPNTGPSKMCTFCRKNGETPLVYMTHTVKEKLGNRNIVTCPILRSHVCSTCGASGDDAHTITYCPVLRSTNNGQPLQSTTITLKNTRVKSNGRRRY